MYLYNFLYIKKYRNQDITPSDFFFMVAEIQTKPKYEVITEEFRSEEWKKKAKETIEEIIRELKETEDIGEWLDGVLEIRRVQSYNGYEWETNYYEFLITTGAPEICLSTNGEIKYYWYPDKFIVKIKDEEVLNKLEDIEEYLNEILP